MFFFIQESFEKKYNFLNVPQYVDLNAFSILYLEKIELVHVCECRKGFFSVGESPIN